MPTLPSGLPLVKEFRFFPQSNIVTVVFQDDKTEDFTGPSNYDRALTAADGSAFPYANLGLIDQKGDSISMIVNNGTPVETFAA